MFLIKKYIRFSTIISFILIISIFLTLSYSFLIGYYSQKQSLIDNTLEMNYINSGQMADTINNLFLVNRESLSLTSKYVHNYLNNDKQLKFYVDNFKQNNNFFNEIAIINNKGVLLYTTSNDYYHLVNTKIDTFGINQALSRQKPLVTQPYIAASGNLIVLISHPIFDDNHRYLGLIGGIIYLEQHNIFQNLFGQMKNQNSNSVYIVDKSGYLLYHPDSKSVGKELDSNVAIELLIKSKSGKLSITNNKNIKMLAGYNYVKQPGWMVVTQTPKSTILKSSSYYFKTMLLYFIPFTVCIIFVLLWISKLITRPLRKLTDFANEIYENKGRKIEIPNIITMNYEVERLKKSFFKAINVMNNKIHFHINESMTDPLTGLLNRRTIHKTLQSLINNKSPFSIISLDIDYFKSINDNYGHQIGDDVLKFLTQKIKMFFRDADLCYRMGGEEFMILLPETSLQDAVNLAEEFKVIIENSINPIDNKITISLGVVSYPEISDNVLDLLTLVDQYLYDAKNKGRNQVCYEKNNKNLLD